MKMWVLVIHPQLFVWIALSLACSANGQGPDSCVGKCGTWSDDCWCNTDCESYGNCCSDYNAVCKAVTCKKCGGYNCDEWIEWDPKRYTCQSLERDYDCDCRGCSKCHGPQPAPYQNAAKLETLDSSRYPTARCLDGSMAGYYIRKGTEPNFLLSFQGGGWCYDDDCASPTEEGTLRNCRDRSRSRLGSSDSWPEWEDSYLTGMLSANPSENPTFHNWTLVYIPYCDGVSFSGNAEVGGLHFRGKAILDAIINELKSSTAIQQAPQVVLSGGSAGGTSVLYHADGIAKDLNLETGEVLALPDAGFFLNLKDKDGIDCWPSQMISVFNVSKGYDSLHEGCLSRFKEQPWKCIFPENYADLIATRTFLIQTLYDSSEISYTLRLSCCPGVSCKYANKCRGDQLQLFQAMREEHIKAWTPLIEKPGYGVWAPACIAHTITWGKFTDKNWEVPANSGNTMAAVVEGWLRNETQGSFIYEDRVAYPNNAPCADGDIHGIRTTNDAERLNFI